MTIVLGPDWTHQLIELLDQQCRIYRQLQDLSQKQTETVEKGDSDALMLILSTRQKLIDQLQHINGQMDPFRQQWSSLWLELDAQARQEIDERVEEIQQYLEDIVTQDEADRANLIAQRDQVGQELQHSRTAGQAHAAYRTTVSNTPRYTDQQG